MKVYSFETPPLMDPLSLPWMIDDLEHSTRAMINGSCKTDVVEGKPTSVPLVHHKSQLNCIRIEPGQQPRVLSTERPC